MPRKNINFELDFMKKDIFPRFTVKQFDDVSFNIKPKNQGLDYDTTGMTGKIFVGVNNDMFMQTTGITVSSNNIKVLLDKNMLQNRGRAYAEIELTDSHGTITSSSFIFNIDEKIGEGAKIPGGYEGFVAKYERLISEFKAQVNSTIDNCNTNINSTINNCNKAVDNKLNDVDNFIDNKILDIEKRFNTLTSSQQQESEIIDARDGEVSLKARLDRDLYKDGMSLSDRIEAIEGLKDSQNMKYETDKGYLVCKETKNGVIDDLKIEGKTLVNLIKSKLVTQTANTNDTTEMGKVRLIEGNTYTVIYNLTKASTVGKSSLGYYYKTYWLHESTWENLNFSSGVKIYTFEARVSGDVSFRWWTNNSTTDVEVKDFIILEGDHTQNPPSYFEGLMSVGGDVDKIEVLSVKNLLDYTKLVNKVTNGTTGVISINNNRLSLDVDNRIEINSPYISVKCNDVFVAIIGHVEKDGTPIYDSGYLPLNTTSKLSLPSEVKYITINAKVGNETPISKEVLKNVFIYHQSDKKQILFYNENGELEPIQELHEWDSIEKHSDNKWYYHKRSGKRSYQAEDENNSSYITDMTNTVYQLAEEEIYELAPLHLDSYANETLILCNSGAISPKMEFSITSHINELVKAYGERVNLLEEKVYQYMVTQNRMQLASTYSADSVTFKVDYFSLCGDEENYDEDLYNLILNNILVGKDNYDYDKMFTIILDYASWNQISWEQFDILVGLMDMQHNPPIEELPPEDVIEEDIIENETPVE